METSIQDERTQRIEVVNARLNYLSEATAKPINYENVFVERVLPSSVIPQVSSAEMDHYRKPFVTSGDDRRTTLTWAAPDSTRW